MWDAGSSFMVNGFDICIRLTRVHGCNASLICNICQLSHQISKTADRTPSWNSPFEFEFEVLLLLSSIYWYQPTGKKTKKHKREAIKLSKTKLHNMPLNYHSWLPILSSVASSITIIALPSSLDRSYFLIVSILISCVVFSSMSSCQQQ